MQLVDLGAQGQHQFPDDATPDEIQAAIDENFPRPDSTFLERQSPLKAASRAAVEGVAGQAKGLGLITEIMPAVSDPAEYHFMPPDVLEMHLQRARRTPAQVLSDVAQNPLYQAGKALQAGAEEAYPLTTTERAGVTTKLAGGLGSFVPFLAEGPLGIAGIGLQTAGERLETDFQKEVDKGKSPDDAASATIGKALGAGTLQSALFAVLPPQLRKLGDKFIDKFASGVVSRFLLGRLTHTTEGAALGTASAALDQAVSGELSPEQLADSAFGLGLAQLFMPRGATRREAEARQAFEGGPSRREIRDRAQAQAWAETFGAGLGPPRETQMVQTSPEVFTGTGETPRPTFLRPLPEPTAAQVNPYVPPEPGPMGVIPPIAETPIQEGAPNAAVNVRVEPESRQPEYPRIAPGQNVPPNAPEVRQVESEQAGRGDSTQRGQEGQAQAPGQPEVVPVAQIESIPATENGARIAIVLPNGTAVVGGRFHADTWIRAVNSGIATDAELANGFAGFVKPDGTAWGVNGKPLPKVSQVYIVGTETPKPPARPDQRPPEPAPAEVAPKPTHTPADLEPALLVNGVPETGGKNHGEIKDTLLSKAKNQDERNAILEAFLDDNAHIFVDKAGKQFNRVEAARAVGELDPLQSERLADLKAKTPPPKQYAYRSPYRPVMSLSQYWPKGWRMVDENTVAFDNPLTGKQVEQWQLEPLDPNDPINIKKAFNAFREDLMTKLSPEYGALVKLKDGRSFIVSDNIGDAAEVEKYPFRITTIQADGTPSGHMTFRDWDEVIRNLWGWQKETVSIESGKKELLPSPAKSGTVVPAEGTGTVTVRTATGAEASLPRSNEAEKAAAMTAEPGATPGRQPPAGPRSPGLTEEDGVLFAIANTGKLPMFIPPRGMMAEYVRMRKKYRLGGMAALSAKERDRFRKMLEIFPENFEDDFGVNGAQMRAAYEAAKKAGIENEIFRVVDTGKNLRLDVLLKNLAEAPLGGTYSARELYRRVEQLANAHRERKAETKADVEGQAAEADVKAARAFNRDVSVDKPGTRPLAVADLRKGAQFKLKGTKLIVEALDFDDDGNVISVTLRDGAKYGTRVVEGNVQLRMDEGSLKLPKSAETETEWVTGEIEEPPAAAPAEQPPVASVPMGGEKPPAAPAKPAAAGPAVDLFGNPIEPPKPEAPPEEPGFVQEGLDLGGAAAKPSGVQERPLTKAEQEEFRQLSIKARSNREAGGPPLTTEETQRYEYLGALAGQKSFGFKAPEGKEAIKGQIKSLASQLNRLYDEKPSSSFGKRAEKWRENVRRVEKQIRELRTELTEGEGEFLGETQPKETPAGYFGTRQFRIRKLPSDEVNERFPTVDQRMAIIKQYGGLDNLWVAESRRVDYNDAFGKDLFEKFEWYVDGYGTSGKDAIAEAKALKRKGWDELPENKAAPPKPAEPPKEVPQQISEKVGETSPEGSTVNGWVKYRGGWYKLDESGKLPMVQRKAGGEGPKYPPANTTVSKNLEAEFKRGPAPEDTRSPQEILKQASQVRVKLPEGATVLRVTDNKGKSTQIFIADLNKGDNVLRGVDIGKLEAGFINKEKKFEPIKGDVKVTDVGKRQLSVPTSIPEAERKTVYTTTLGLAQRGNPERAMLRVQRTNGGGVLNFVVEHVGDITHRMADPNTWDSAGYETVLNKVNKTLRSLTEKYGFVREMQENHRGNAAYWKRTAKEQEDAVGKALRQYAEEHQKLPVYNRAQEAARDAAVAIGHQDWYGAVVRLEYLKAILDKGQEEWTKAAHDYDPEVTARNGQPRDLAIGSKKWNWERDEIPEGAAGISVSFMTRGPEGEFGPSFRLIVTKNTIRGERAWRATLLEGRNPVTHVSGDSLRDLATPSAIRNWKEEMASRSAESIGRELDQEDIDVRSFDSRVFMNERDAMLTAEEAAKEPSRRAVMMGEPIKLETTADIRRVLDDKLSNITQEHRKFFSWLLDKGLLDKYPGLRMEVVDEIQRGPRSDVMPSGEHVGNISRFLRWTDSDAPLHEFMHHIERFLSAEDREWIHKERLKYLSDHDFGTWKILQNGISSDEFMASGLSRGLYHLSNDSEFFAWMMTEKGLKELNRPEATTFVGKIRELIKDLWQGVKRAFGLQPYEDTLWQNILKGKVEYDTAQAIKSNERQASLIRTTEQREKELELGRVGAIGQSPYQVDVRISGAYGDPLRMIAKEADDLNISDGARRILGMPRKAELWTRAQAAIGGKLSIFGYSGARDWAKDKTPNERWQVTSDALRSLGNEEADWRIIDERFEALKNRITSPGFVKRLESLAKLEWQKDAAVEKEETYRNVRMVNISKTMNEISKAGIDSAQEEILRQDIAAEKNALNFATAVGQRMDAIVSKVFPNYWQFGASSRSAQGFYDLYLSVMRGEGTPVTDPRELAYLRFASETLAVNRYMRDRLYWLEAMKREPDFQTAINDFGKAFVQRLQANPGEALRELITKEGRLATKAERAAAAWKTLNSKLMRDLNDYAKYEEAKEVKDRVQASADWQNLVRTVHTDAEALHVPPEYVEQIKKGYYDEANPVLVEIDPAGKTYTLDFGFTKETAAKAQGEIEAYLQSIRDWLYTNKEHPDAPFWQRKLDFIDSVYNTMGVTNPMAVKSLGFKFTRTSWGMPQYLFSQMKIPGAKIVQTMLENWRRSQSLAQNWLAEHTAPIIRAARDAAKGHGYNAFTPGWMQAYREAMFNSIAWRYRHNLPVTEGMTLNGFKVTKADIAYMKRVGFAENQRYRQIENLGVEKAMPDPLLFDKWRENTFSIRRPQEFGTEPLTTVSRERSQRGKLLSTSMAKLDGKDFQKIQALLETEEAWPWVVRWLNERSPDYTVLTPWEPQLREVYNKMNERLPNVAGEPLDTIDSIAKEIAANVPEEYTEAGIKEALLGQMHAELTKHFNTHYKTEPNPDVRVIAATRESSFTRAFQHDTTNSYAYDYGLTNAQELHSFAIDSSMYWLSRFQRGLDGLIKHMSDALAEVDLVKTNPAKLAALKERNRDLFNSGDDFRDYEDLQMQANELKQFRDSIGIWSGQDVKRYEGLTNLYRFVDDMAALVLSGWRTITRVFWGSTVKEGFTMGALERWSSLSTAKSVASMAISLSRVLTVGPATLVARRLKILPKFEKEVSGIAEEWFRTLKFFDAQYPYGLGFKTPTYDTIANVLTMPVTRGGRYMAELSTNRAMAMVQRGGYHAVSGLEAPLEFVKTVFPTLGYAVQYDSVCRQIKWWLEGLEKRARRTFNTYEQMGKLDRFDFNNPKNPKNALTPQEVIGDGIFPATATALAHNNEMFRRGMNVGVNDVIMMFWKRLKETSPEQRGQIHLLSADKPAGTPQPELLKSEQGRFGALATSGLMDIHHAAIVNRTWALRASPFGRMAWRLAGWAVQSTRQWFAVMGYATGDPRFRSVMMRALTYAAVAAALGTQIIMGDAEKRIFEELKWLVNREIDPVKHLGQGADKKETARIAISDMMTYITMLNGYVDSILSAKANRQSLTDSIFVVQQIKSLLQYVAGVAQTHDPLYGLPALAKRGAPITQPFVNRLPVTSGIVARNNARTIIQKWAPPDLNRQTGSSFGMPTATELTPYKEKLAAAIYNGDSLGTAEAYAAFIDKAQELGRPDPENLAKQTVRSLNPYSIALIAHPTDEQRAAMLEKMPQSERDHLLDYENRYAAATQMLGISSEMTRQDRGKATGGTTASTAAPVARFSGVGGSPIPSGTSGRRISLSGGGGGGLRTGFGGGFGGGMGPSGGRAPMGPGLAGRRLSLRQSRARGTRLVRGRLRSRSGRTMIARGRTPKRRRLSLIA